jgi:hypothetical protein
MQRPRDRVVVIKGKWCPTDVVKLNVSSEIFSEFNLKNPLANISFSCYQNIEFIGCSIFIGHFSSLSTKIALISFIIVRPEFLNGILNLEFNGNNCNKKKKY